MDTGDFSGFDLSMSYDDELGIGGIQIATNERALTTFFCSCQPSPPSAAKSWAGQRVVIPGTTRWTVDKARIVRLPVPPNSWPHAPCWQSCAMICCHRSLAEHCLCVDLITIPLPCYFSNPTHASHHGASEQPVGVPSKRDSLHVQRSSCSPSHIMTHCTAAATHCQTHKNVTPSISSVLSHRVWSLPAQFYTLVWVRGVGWGTGMLPSTQSPTAPRTRTAGAGATPKRAATPRTDPQHAAALENTSVPIAMYTVCAHCETESLPCGEGGREGASVVSLLLMRLPGHKQMRERMPTRALTCGDAGAASVFDCTPAPLPLPPSHLPLRRTSASRPHASSTPA